MMITISEALEIIRSQKVEPIAVSKGLEDIPGFALAEEIIAPFDIPSFDNSAMDGYALCGLHGEYQIIGEVAAGDTGSIELLDGQAVRIFTGAKVPAQTTAVIMQERTRVKKTRLSLEELPRKGQNIRKKGGELLAGQVIFEKGHVMNPAAIGLLGSLGLDRISVFKKPRINLMVTGDELVPPGQPRKEGQIYESNSFALAAAADQSDFSCSQRSHLKDDFRSIKDGIGKFLENSDVLLLSGGISVGDYDFVKQALEENEVTQLFYKVFQKPGKPLYFGRKGNTFVFGLPGNPASSLTCFYIYVLPLLHLLSGFRKTGLERLSLPVSHEIENSSDRPSFLKAKITAGQVEVLNAQASSMLRSMAMGNALVFLFGETKVKKGALVECYLIP